MKSTLPLTRRGFLRASGVLMALPALESVPRLDAAGNPTPAGNPAQPPRRFVAIQTTQGIMPHLFFPRDPGPDYSPSPYLEILKPLRNQFTVFSGLSHPGVDGGHANEVCFLTGAPHPGTAGFRNRVSIDQILAEHFGNQTRFPFLATAAGSSQSRTMSYNRAGVVIPPDRGPAHLFQRLFVNGSQAEVDAQVRALQDGRSLLDSLRDRVRHLQASVTPADRDKLDQYFTSIRELEQQLLQSEAWVRKPKPNVTPPPNLDTQGQLFTGLKATLDILRLALQSDSTRIVTVFYEPLGVLREIDGVQHETHSLTHHGNRPEMIQELRRIEEAQFKALLAFLQSLQQVPEANGSLLDHSVVLYGTCMGNANGHSNQNWPLLLAGGGFRHGSHLAFDRTNNTPIGRLFASIFHSFQLNPTDIPAADRSLQGLDRA